MGLLEWVAVPFFRKSSQPRDWTWVSCIAGRFFAMWVPREGLVRQDLVRQEPWVRDTLFLALPLLASWGDFGKVIHPYFPWIFLSLAEELGTPHGSCTVSRTVMATHPLTRAADGRVYSLRISLSDNSQLCFPSRKSWKQMLCPHVFFWEHWQGLYSWHWWNWQYSTDLKGIVYVNKLWIYAESGVCVSVCIKWVSGFWTFSPTVCSLGRQTCISLLWFIQNTLNTRKSQ